jgi:dynactin complex subunit
MAEVIVEALEEVTESGAHRALRAERVLRKQYEREAAALKHDLAARVARLEARGLGPVLDALATMRRDHAAEEAKLRAELRELADAVDQLRSLIAQP